MRIGHGYDVHALVRDRDLILGGVNIPFEFGLLGHSDADVLVHAVIDALLGAAGLGDIGRNFPDTNEKYKGISSLTLLSETWNKLSEAGYSICNIDTVLIAQKPKLSEYLDEMSENMANALKIDRSLINVKATTEEGLGFTGDGSGISAHSICLIDHC